MRLGRYLDVEITVVHGRGLVMPGPMWRAPISSGRGGEGYGAWGAGAITACPGATSGVRPRVTGPVDSRRRSRGTARPITGVTSSPRSVPSTHRRPVRPQGSTQPLTDVPSGPRSAPSTHRQPVRPQGRLNHSQTARPAPGSARSPAGGRPSATHADRPPRTRRSVPVGGPARTRRTVLPAPAARSDPSPPHGPTRHPPHGPAHSAPHRPVRPTGQSVPPHRPAHRHPPASPSPRTAALLFALHGDSRAS